MAIFDWPATLIPQSLGWGLQKAVQQFRSPAAGSVETLEFPGAYWTASVTLPDRKLVRGGEVEALFARLAGGADRIRVPAWHRMTPIGTMRGTPTVAVAAHRGDLTISISTTGTLAAGDFFAIANDGQLFQCLTPCTASGGVLQVPLVNRVRSTIAAGAAVLWQRPTFLGLIPSTSGSANYQPRKMAGLQLDLEEAPS